MSFVIACSPVVINGFQGIPNNTFYGVNPVFPEDNTLGNLTSAFITNTESLIQVNNRLEVLCKARELTNCGPR